MARETEKKETENNLQLAAEFIESFENDLHPQMNKLRLVREMARSLIEGSVRGFTEMPKWDVIGIVDGLELILGDVLDAYEKTCGMTPMCSFEWKEEAN